MSIDTEVSITIKQIFKIHLFMIGLFCRLSLPLSTKYYGWFLKDVKNNTKKYIKYKVSR